MNTSQLHPFDPLTPEEVKPGVAFLQKALPGAPLRFKQIDVLEPIKKDAVPYLEAERRGMVLSARPPRLLFSYFHCMDTLGFFKAGLNADTRQPVYMKEHPKDVQVQMFHTSNGQ